MQITTINKLNIAHDSFHPGWFEELALPELSRFPTCLDPDPNSDWNECAAP